MIDHENKIVFIGDGMRNEEIPEGYKVFEADSTYDSDYRVFETDSIYDSSYKHTGGLPWQIAVASLLIPALIILLSLIN